LRYLEGDILRILQISNKLPYPPKDGGAIATLSMSRSFVKLGHEVSILSMNTSKHYFDPENIPQDLKSIIDFHTVNIDTDITPLDAFKNLLFSKLPYNAERFINEDFKTKLVELLKNSEFDVIQLEGLYVAPYIDSIRKHSKAIVSMRAHNIEFEIWERTAKQNVALKKYYLKNLASRIRRMELKYMNSYDCVIPITSRDDNSLKKLGCIIPSHVCPTGIFTTDLDDNRNSIEYPSLFHIGALDWGPNQEGIIWFLDKVWPKLNKKYPELKFYIAGRNAPPKISKINIAGVKYLGEVEDAHDLMRSKAIMIDPLLSGSGMRIKIIEGMALGKSIVTTSIGTEGINSTHDENILIANNPDSFYTEIQKLLDNFDNFEVLGQNASQFVRLKYDNIEITKKLADFYTKLL